MAGPTGCTKRWVRDAVRRGRVWRRFVVLSVTLAVALIGAGGPAGAGALIGVCALAAMCSRPARTLAAAAVAAVAAGGLFAAASVATAQPGPVAIGAVLALTDALDSGDADGALATFAADAQVGAPGWAAVPSVRIAGREAIGRWLLGAFPRSRSEGERWGAPEVVAPGRVAWLHLGAPDPDRTPSGAPPVVTRFEAQVRPDGLIALVCFGATPRELTMACAGTGIGASRATRAADSPPTSAPHGTGWLLLAAGTAVASAWAVGKRFRRTPHPLTAAGNSRPH